MGHEVGKVSFELIISLAMVALGSRFLNPAVDSLDLAMFWRCLISVSRCSIPFSCDRILNIYATYHFTARILRWEGELDSSSLSSAIVLRGRAAIRA